MIRSFVLSLAFCAMTHAATVAVLPGDPSWSSSANSGGGSSTITSSASLGTTLGSLRLTGDRTRFAYPSPAGNLGLLADLDSFGFSWRVGPGSTSNLGANYSPALRLIIVDPGNGWSGELIWENTEQPLAQAVTQGEWYSVDAMSANLWRWVYGGSGRTFTSGGAQVNQTVGQWLANAQSPYYTGSNVLQPGFSSAAYIAAISIGVGSSAGSGYLAYADLVRLGFSGGEVTTFDFGTQVVPEPSTWLAAATGLALVAFRLRRARRA